MSAEARLYPDRLLLERLDAVSIRSLTPAGRLFQPLSWRLAADLERWREHGGDAGDLLGSLGGGVGFTLAPTEASRIALLVNGRALADDDWPHGRLAAAGPSLDVTWRPAQAWTVAFDADAEAVVGRGTLGRYSIGPAVALAVAPDLSLQATATWRNDGDNGYLEWRLGLGLFF